MTEQNHTPPEHATEHDGASGPPTYPGDDPKPGYSNALAVPSPNPPAHKDDPHGITAPAQPQAVHAPTAPTHAPAGHKSR